MALVPLAGAADLTARGVDTTDAALVDAMLAAATDAIRDAAGAAISRTVSTVTLEGVEGRRLHLPSGPVHDVTAVSIDGEPAADWRLVSGALWRAAGWAGREPSLVEVTYDHGHDPVPADIVELVCDFATAGILNAGTGTHAGLTGDSERIDDYSHWRQFAAGDEATASAMEVPAGTRRMLRRRFGGGAFVTGGGSE